MRIPHVKNFRDLGGIITTDGHVVASRRLLRSGSLHRLTKRGARRLTDCFDLRLVVDLRLQSERQYKPNREVPGIKTELLSPMPEEKRSAVRRDNRSDMLREIMRRPDGAPGHMMQDYRELVTDPVALTNFRRFFRLLCEQTEGSVLWHCSMGKDRTGVLAAFVLMALGVDREEIMRDYLRTHRAYRTINHIYYSAVLLLKCSRMWARSLVQVLDAYPEYLQTVFDTIDAEYGDTDTFLGQGLGLSQEDLLLLRSAYLL